MTVKNTDKKYTTNPEVKCNNCGKEFSGGVSRIGEHITTKCKGSGDAFEALKTKVLKETEARTDCKKRKAAEAYTDEQADAPAVKVESGSGTGIKKQRGIEAAFAVGNDADLDGAIAEMVYGCNLSFGLVSAPPPHQPCVFTIWSP